MNTFNFKQKLMAAGLLMLTLLLSPSLSYGQALTGMKYIPGSYSSLAAAISDLNTNGVGTGGVVFNIAAGATETAPSGGYVITATGTAANPIVFQKDPATTGVNPTFTSQAGATTNLDGIFLIAGGDYITFDGLNLVESASNTTTTTQMEFGFAFLKRNATAPFDGCQRDTVRNCSITLARTNAASRGIYANNHTMLSTAALTITAASDANNYIGLINNTIQNVNTGIYFYGFNAAAPFTLYDNYNAAIGNTILNFAGASAGNGIYFYYQSNNNASYNYIDNYNGGLNGAIGTSGAIYGIYNYNSTSSANPSNLVANNNYFRLTAAAGSSAAMYGIYHYYSQGNITINNNTVKWVTLGSTVCTGSYYGFYIYPSSYSCNVVQVMNNHIDSNTVNNSTGTMYGVYIYGGGTTNDISGNTFTYFTRNLATTGVVYGLYNYYNPNYNIAGTVTNIYNNVIDSINQGSSTGALYPTYLGGAYTTNVYNNTIARIYAPSSTGSLYALYLYYYATNINAYNNYINSIRVAGTLYGINYYGIYFQNGNLYNNTISNLITSGTTASLVGCYVTYAGLNSLNIYKNRINSLLASGNSTCAAQGLLIYNSYSGAPSNLPVKIYNNLLSDIQAPASTNTTVSVSGININYSNYAYAAYLYYNTIYLSGNAGPNSHSSCIYVNNTTPPTLRMNNNILINKLTHGGTGVASAYFRSGGSTSNYDNLSNGNLFYAGVPTGKNVIYFDGTNRDSLIALFKSRVSPRESNSATEDLSFISTSPFSPDFLKPDTLVPTSVESGASNIAGIADDYLGKIRAGNAGYTGTGTSPDIGAFEANYTPIPMVYDSNNVDQITAAVLVGKTNQVVLRIRVYVSNNYSPMSVTRFKLNTSGTTSVANISNAKLFYTGSSTSFSATNQYGAVVAAPNGVFYMNGSQVLSPGINNFWLTYDIASNASMSNVVDGRVDSVMVGGIYRLPINGDPAGGTPISAPLNGVYTIGTAPYFSLADIVTDLNQKGLSGNVVVNVPAGYTELAPVGGYVLGSTLLNSNLSAASRLSFVKNGLGQNPLLYANTGTSTTIDALFLLRGCDYVTINGIDLLDTNTVSVTTQMEQGYALVKFNGVAPFDGCQFDTIMNSTITLKRTNVNSRGIYINNAAYGDGSASSLVLATPADANSYNVIMNDSVQNVSSGIVFGGMAASANPSLYDQNNTVTGCVVVNFNGGGGTGYGIYFMNQVNNSAVNNYIDNYNGGAAGAVAATSTIYGIFNSFNNTSSANPSNVFTDNNYVKLTQNGGSSGATYGIYVNYSHGNIKTNNNRIKYATAGTSVVTGTFYGAYIYPSSYSANILEFKNNHLDSMTFNSSTGSFYGLYMYGGGLYNEISGNTISYITRTGATSGSFYGFYAYYNPNYSVAGSYTNWTNNLIDSISNGTSTGSVYLGYCGGAYTMNINANTISRIYAPSGSSIYAFYPYYNTLGNVFNNTVSNIVGGTSAVYGIYAYGAYTNTYNIYGNNISRITAGASSGSVYGIYDAYAGLVSMNIYRNIIDSLTVPSATGTIHGIYIQGAYSGAPSNMPITVHNNLIGSLNAPASTANPAMCGINFNYSSYNYFGYAYYNTINLNGAVGVNGSTAGIYVGSLTPMVQLNNNVVVNNSLVSGTGYASAIQRNGASLGTFSLASDNNLLYAGIPGTYRVIYNDGTNRDQTIAAYKSRVSPAESSSLTENVAFLNVNYPSSPDYLRPDSTVATGIESGAQNIAGLNADYTAKVRQGNAGYVGSGSSPDIGAYEGNYILNDVIPPVISYTVLGNTASTGDRTIVVNIKDKTGVPETMYSPVLFYKKFASGYFNMAYGTKISGNAKDGNWSFTISQMMLGGLTLGDSVYYYIAAQDSSVNTNLGSIPAGVQGFNISSITNPPNALYSYKIVPGMSGNFTVGATGTFLNLTNPGGAFDAINNSALSGHVTLTVVSDLNESGLVTLKKWSETGSGNYTVRIVPDGPVERQIVDTAATPVANSAVITFDGATRATIDGRYNGSGKYLRVRNRGANGIAFLFKNDATHDTIQYCNIECVTTVTATIVFGATNVPGGRGNDSNVVIYNNLGDTLGAVAPGGASNTAFFSQGTSGMENDANIISYNNIYNFGYNAVNLTGGGTGSYWTFYGNNVYQTVNRATASAYYMFYVTQGGGHIFRKNSIGGSMPGRNGLPINNTSGYWYVFYQSSTNLVPNVYDSNVIANFNTAYLYPFYISQGNANINNNVIGGMQNPWDTIQFANTLYGVYLNYYPMVSNVMNNQISDIRYNGAGTGYLNGIHVEAYGGPTTVSGNRIYNLYSNGSGALPTYNFAGIALYQNSTGLLNVDNNTIYNIQNSSIGSAVGIVNYYNYGTQNVTRNRIYNITSAGGSAVGFYNYYNSYPSTFTNNMISMSNTNGTTSVVGIQDAVTNAIPTNYYNNSVFIGGTAGSASLVNSYAFYRSSNAAAIDVKNNIFYNKRTGGNGFHYAAGYSSANLFGPASLNYNLMVTADTAKLIETPGAVATGVAAVNALYTGPANSNWMASSAAVPAQTLFTDTAVANLGIVTTNANCWYVNGKGLALASVSSDVNGNARSMAINSGATDIGAMEFTTSTTPPAATASAAPALNGTTDYVFGGRKVASITWGPSGTVPASVNVVYYTGVNAPSLLASKTQFNAYHSITPTGGSGYTYRITTSYDSSMFGNVTSTVNTRLARYTSPSWYLMSGSSANGTTGMLTSGTTMLAATTLPANFTGTDNSTPLPVELLNLQAVKSGNDVLVSWATASEHNSRGFEIERSYDHVNFEFAGSIAAKGKSNQTSAYHFADAGAFATANSGVVFYRLKMVDLDGSFEYSDVVAVTNDQLHLDNAVSVYPNPFNNQVHVSVVAAEATNANVMIYDVTGKCILNNSIRLQQGTNWIDTTQMISLGQGVYFLTVEVDGVRTSSKLIKE